MSDVLIIDDEPSICESLRDLLGRNGITADTAQDRAGGLTKLDSGDYEVVLLDLRMPGVQGLSLLREIREKAPRLPVVMITAFATVETAVQAMKEGAHDFITKPIDLSNLLRVLEPALRHSEAESETNSLFVPLSKDLALVCRDPVSLELVQRAKKLAASNISILITGETGVGKEVFARLIHDYGARRAGPFVKVNCAAIAREIFESELFGHQKGAFTGAVTDKHGRVEIAEGGTLFLDEIGELPLPAQAKLLQFLQDCTFERVGDARTRTANVRVVAATNRNPSEALRQDIVHRLETKLEIRPLRERPGDIEALARYFLDHQSRKVSLAPGTLEALQAFSWPGNVRMLANRIGEAVALSETGVLTAGDILPGAAQPRTLFEARDLFEKNQILNALEKTMGNRTEAAKLLGLSRRGLQKKIREFGI
jgi:DNA-binding NtrC family response regulator